jgi:hypothetical protein
MKKSAKVWLVGWTLFWLSFVVTFLVDISGVFEASNSGFFETLWISWILWSAGLGLALSILIGFIMKE